MIGPMLLLQSRNGFAQTVKEDDESGSVYAVYA
jgi:hypothetical protein